MNCFLTLKLWPLWISELFLYVIKFIQISLRFLLQEKLYFWPCKKYISVALIEVLPTLNAKAFFQFLIYTGKAVKWTGVEERKDRSTSYFHRGRLCVKPRLGRCGVLEPVDNLIIWKPSSGTSKANLFGSLKMSCKLYKLLFRYQLCLCVQILHSSPLYSLSKARSNIATGIQELNKDFSKRHCPHMIIKKKSEGRKKKCTTFPFWHILPSNNFQKQNQPTKQTDQPTNP